MKKTADDSPVIENIVSAGSVADAIDREFIADTIPGCTFSRKKFPGAVCHMKNLKSIALIFASGTVVLTGIVRHDDIPVALENLVSNLKGAGIPCHDAARVSVKNIVCTCNPGKACNPGRILVSLMDPERVEYEPECFPGLVCRIADPRIVFLVFSSGKCVITGGKTVADIRRGLAVFMEKLKVAGTLERDA
jgi:transcription initiation factor TFIID TATA-box-binding protein